MCVCVCFFVFFMCTDPLYIIRRYISCHPLGTLRFGKLRQLSSVQPPTWLYTLQDQEIHAPIAQTIVEFLLSSGNHPVDIAEIFFQDPPLNIKNDFVVIEGTHINWPRRLSETTTHISMPMMLFHVLHQPDYLFHMSYALDKESRFIAEHGARSKELTKTQQCFMLHVVDWLLSPIINSKYVDEALSCCQFDVQIVVSMGSQILKAVFGDTHCDVLTQCITSQWKLHPPTPFYRAFHNIVTSLPIPVRAVLASAKTLVSTKRVEADYVIDNSLLFMSTNADKTIIFMLVLFSQQHDFLEKWAHSSDAWRECSGVPCDAVRNVLNNLVGATSKGVVPPLRYTLC